MKQDNASSTKQAESRSRSGNNPVIEKLRELGLPVTRENYLKLEYGKDVPEMTAELEAELPATLRRRQK